MYKKYIKQIIDTIIATILFIILLPLMILALIITFIDLGTPLHNTLRYREGKNKKPNISIRFFTAILNNIYRKSVILCAYFDCNLTATGKNLLRFIKTY